MCILLFKVFSSLKDLLSLFLISPQLTLHLIGLLLDLLHKALVLLDHFCEAFEHLDRNVGYFRIVRH